MTDHLPENVLDQLVEGRASGTVSGVEVHLLACPICRGRVKRWEEFHRRLFSLPREESPAGLENRMRQAMTRQQRQQKFWRWAVIGAVCSGLSGVLLLWWESGGPLVQWLQTLQWPGTGELTDAAIRFFESPWTVTADSGVYVIDGLSGMAGQFTLGLAVGITLVMIATTVGTARLLAGRKGARHPAF